ncbi:hypothetical protein L6R53_30345 [Myxococcota bacterium]|nr:hypothetical protein [Myxococcota bacterium]
MHSLRPPHALALLCLSGCAFVESDGRWSDQLQADGPCWRVDLADGLDESSTSELRDLFACVNRQGAVEPLAPMVDALEEPSRAGVSLGVELAGLVNDLPAAEVDLGGLLDLALELLEDEARPIEPLSELVVELVYGRPYAQVTALPDPGSAQDLDQGVLRPALPVVGVLAGVALDQPEPLLPLLADTLVDPALADATCTLVGLATTTDVPAGALGADLLPALGDALERATDDGNDLWDGASGDSLRDLVQALLVTPGEDGQSAARALRPLLLPMLQDELLVANLRQTLAEARDAGRVETLPAQLRYLATVDVQGRDLVYGQDSALLALLRLLDGANTEVSCSLDLVITELTIDLGNLSVALLGILAEQDPEQAADGVGLISEVLGWGFTEDTLDFVADSGLCPVIDDQLVSDLGAIDRLSDPEVDDLLVVLLSALTDLRDGEEDHLVGVVDLASALYGRGLVPPAEEALRDLGGSSLAADLSLVVGLVLAPEVLAVEGCPTGSAPLTFEGLVGLLRAALADRLGGAPVEVFEPVLQAALAREETWTALHNMGALLRSADARALQGLSLLAELVRLDPDLSLRQALVPLLEEPDLVYPALRLVEAPSLLEAAAAPSDAARQGPLPWLARLVTGGTLDSVLRTVDLALDLLGGATGDTTPPPDGSSSP